MKNLTPRGYIALIACIVIAPGCVSAQVPDDGPPPGVPTTSRDQQMIHQQSVPREFETEIYVNDDDGRKRAEQLMEIYRVLSTDPSIENVQEHVSDGYIQHSVMLPNGPQPLAMLFSQSVAQYPIQIDVHRIAISGDFGIAHVNFRNLDNDNPDDLGTAAVDMYLWGKDGKIVEHWDVLQAVPTHSANTNTMFLKLFETEE